MQSSERVDADSNAAELAGNPPPSSSPGGAAGGPAVAPAGAAIKYTETSNFALWEKYEDVAMHFNELIIRLRTQALGGLTGVVALSGLAINFAQKPDSRAQWVILCGTLIFFSIAWVALWVLDLGYYDKLLSGAVDAILEHEKRTHTSPDSGPAINLSHKISAGVGKYRVKVMWFYGLVLAALSLGVGYTLCQTINWKPKPREATEYKVQLSHPQAYEVVVEPASPAKKPNSADGTAKGKPSQQQWAPNLRLSIKSKGPTP
jgi:hypothetical protein